MGHEWAAGTALGARWVKRVPSCTTMWCFLPHTKQQWEGFKSWWGGGGELGGWDQKPGLLTPPDVSLSLTWTPWGRQVSRWACPAQPGNTQRDSSPPHPWGSQPPGQAMLVHPLASWLQVPFLTFLRQGRSTSWFSILKKSVLHQLMYGLSK